MASSFSIQSVTDAGRTAMQTALDQGLTFTFSAIKTGNGIYTEGEDVTGLTALKSLKNSYAIGSVEEDENGITLGVVLVNYDGESVIVGDTYNVNEIGIFVTVGGTEYLYAVAAVVGDTGQEMPGYDGDNLTQIVQSWYVPLSNSLEIEVDQSGAFALAQDLANEIETRAQKDFENLYGLCAKTTVVGTDGDGNTQITETDTGNSVAAVTTIVNTSDTVTTITTVVTPTAGDYYYTKTTVITSGDDTTIVESYTSALKEE